MTTGIETVDLIEPWLYDVLSDDTTLVDLVEDRFEVMMGDGGQTLELPKVVWSPITFRDVPNNQGLRIDTITLYDIKAVGMGGSFADVSPIAKRIDELINGASVTLTDGSLTCVRERIIQYVEQSVGVKYLHLGGTYRIRCNFD